MKYRFRTVPTSDLDEKALEYGNVFQSSHWADFKKKYGKVAFCGEDENGKKVLSCLMLTAPVFCTFMKVGYVVRGFVGDMTDETLVSEFTEYLRGYMKKHRIVYLAIDPYESYKTDFEVTSDGKKRHENLINNGYIHFANKAFSMQRPTNYRVFWDRTKSPEEQEVEVWGKMKKMLQNSIKTASERGLDTVRFNGDEITEEVFSEFLRLFKSTAETKHFGMKSDEYYREQIKAFGKHSNIWFFEYDAEKDRAFTEKTLAELSEKISNIEALDGKAFDRKKNQLAEFKDEYARISERLSTIEKYKNEKYLSAFYAINFGRRCHLFYGANSPVLRDLKLTANYWPILKSCFDGECESFDMGGTLRLDTEDVKKDKTYDLYLYKSRYGGVLDELLGEYYLPAENGVMFKLLHEKLHYLRRYAVRF